MESEKQNIKNVIHINDLDDMYEIFREQNSPMLGIIICSFSAFIVGFLLGAIIF